MPEDCGARSATQTMRPAPSATAQVAESATAPTRRGDAERSRGAVRNGVSR
ncbi:Uncharacterised protein [Mycobacteroides abscessus]|nr:Uncharacterised protein [Mycobacteroides abscessus]